MSTIAHRWHLVAIAVGLGVVATLAPEPTWTTDRGTYERMSREWFLPGCGDVHCFRPLVSWILGVLPGATGLVWKGYAVVCQTAAAWAMGRLVGRLGLATRAVPQVMWLTAFGSGALYTLFDPFTSDPLMHLYGPLLVWLLLDARVGLAGALAAVGILAKEFAAIPLWIMGITWAQQDRWRDSRNVLAWGIGVTGLWVAWQLGLRFTLEYSNGLTHSTELTQGGYIAFWLLVLSPSLIVSSLTMVFGALWIVWPAGVAWGNRELRQLTLASIPAMLILISVQQPDRALWNFAFVVMPAVAVVLDRVPALVSWPLVLAQALADLRVGAQLSFVPGARYGLALAGLLALAALWLARPGRLQVPNVARAGVAG